MRMEVVILVENDKLTLQGATKVLKLMEYTFEFIARVKI